MADITDAYNDKEKQERLNEIHRKRTSSDETIWAIVERALDKQPSGYDRIIVGEINEVYLLRFNRGGDLILRIGHDQGRDFSPETWAIERAGEAGVPVAKILATDTYQTGDKRLSYSLQEKLSGERLDTLLWTKKINSTRARRITENAGEILAKIHSVTITTGYGAIDEGGHGEFATAGDWVQAHINNEVSYRRLFAVYDMPNSTFDAVISKLRTATKLFDSKPHLLHADFGPKHLFVDENDTVTGVIDFERAESGDVAVDFASWDIWLKKVVPTEWLYNGYRRLGDLGDNFEARLEIMKLGELLRLLRYYTDVAPVGEVGANLAKAIARMISQ